MCGGGYFFNIYSVKPRRAHGPMTTACRVTFSDGLNANRTAATAAAAAGSRVIITARTRKSGDVRKMSDAATENVSCETGTGISYAWAGRKRPTRYRFGVVRNRRRVDETTTPRVQSH